MRAQYAELPRRGSGGEYPTQDGFGWNNGMGMNSALLKRYPDLAH